MYRYDYVRDNNAFSIEIKSTLEAMKSNLNRSYDKQNEGSFHKFHMKWPRV